MTETITTAAELDALPLGSIVVDPYAATCIRARVSVPALPSDWVRVTVAVKGGEHHHRPFLPAEVIRRGWTDYTDADPSPVKPSREDVSNALMEIFDLGTQPNAFREARAVLDLFPGRSVAEILQPYADALALCKPEWQVLREAATNVDLADSGLMHAELHNAEAAAEVWLRNRADRLESEADHD